MAASPAANIGANYRRAATRPPSAMVGLLLAESQGITTLSDECLAEHPRVGASLPSLFLAASVRPGQCR